MCLIVFAWRAHPDYPLVLAANRDEFHARPTRAMGWWERLPSLLAGKDLEAGGTWLGVTRDGRIAAVTNYREPDATAGSRSRGEIVTGFAERAEAPRAYLASLDGERYAGVSAIATDGARFAYASNRGDDARNLEPGVYGLSNAKLDTAWEKLTRSRSGLDALLDRDPDADALFELMRDPRVATDGATGEPNAALPFAIARELSAPFVRTRDYGTRSTTAIIVRRDGHIDVAERRFDAEGEHTGDSRFTFLAPAWGDSSGTAAAPT